MGLTSDIEYITYYVRHFETLTFLRHFYFTYSFRKRLRILMILIIYHIKHKNIKLCRKKKNAKFLQHMSKCINVNVLMWYKNIPKCQNDTEVGPTIIWFDLNWILYVWYSAFCQCHCQCVMCICAPMYH